MPTVFDIAKYILQKKGSMSTWKLQKLCFYSQAWSLAWTEKPLFTEDFEAWANGPVCKTLFDAHRGKFVISENEISGEPSNLSDDEKDTIDIVLRDYGDMQPYELRELSHNEKPWKEARGGLPEGVYGHTIIEKSAMGSYYGSL